MSRISRAAWLSALTCVMAGMTAAPAEAVDHDPLPANQAASWITGQLTAGLLHDDPSDMDNVPLSADAALALADVEGNDDTVRLMAEAIAPEAYDALYSYPPASGARVVLGGNLARTVVLAQEAGLDPSAYGGHDVLALLQDRVADAAPIVGRLQDRNNEPNQVDADTVGQAFAVRGLSRARSSEASAARAFLLRQQCSSGYFRLAFTASKTAPGQSCVEGVDPADLVATAYAVIETRPLAGDADIDDATARARAWLVQQQKGDGSFGRGAQGDTTTTGLVARALGDRPQAYAAVQWLRGGQATAYDACDKLSTELGSVSPDATGLQKGRSEGVTRSTRAQWRQATVDALPALAFMPVDETPSAPRIKVPSGFVRAGRAVSVGVTGVQAGDRLCLRGAGLKSQVVSAGSTVTQSFLLPSSTTTHSFSVVDQDSRTSTGTVKALGSKRLTLSRSAARVKRSRYVGITIKGLAPGEAAKVVYAGRTVKSGRATAKGTLYARFSVGRSVGKRTVRGYGQFSDIRLGSTTFRVVR